MSIKKAMIFIGGAVTSVERAMTFVGKGGTVVGGLFKTAGIGIKVVNAIKGVNEHNLRQQLIIYKLKDPSLLIYS